MMKAVTKGERAMLITDHCFECDTCHKRTEFYVDREALRTSAVSAGWQHSKGKDHCPECSTNINRCQNYAGIGEGNRVELTEPSDCCYQPLGPKHTCAVRRSHV